MSDPGERAEMAELAFIEERARMAEDELAFISARMIAQREWREPRCWGMSSDALALYAVGARPEPEPSDYPSDPSDLMACVLTYRMAPEHLKESMARILEKFRYHVERRYPGTGLRIEGYLESVTGTMVRL